ncbi:hypothetical protein [Kutzneria buriramensis]|uniref:Uncharacterized protein n=1 Tax=Kutzneria buriramensis TaxID=1045776 RepID=A0A3E0HE96_9PSEU|nr:hypothetical protein [Kutzneria buriramensis]REH42731.1 hypothetical protein BCF44_110228 [Kutzneria buriramensis]
MTLGEAAGDISTWPGLGVVGALVIVVGYLLTANFRLLSANRADRAAYLEALATREASHAADLSALREAYRAELVSLRRRASTLEGRIATLETRIGDLSTELDHERARRRAAEDDAAAARRT